MLGALPLGIAVGLTLGTVGGGGAVLAVPLLVYILGQDVHAATTTSLVVVVAAALVGGAAKAGRARVCWSQVWVFAPAILAGSVAGTLANELASGTTILVAFAPVLLAAALVTWRMACVPEDKEIERACPPLELRRTLAAGLTVGVLTGFFGVGGGFLVVPMLVVGMRFPLLRAIGTSLVIVGFASATALTSHLLQSAELDADLTAVMAVGCVAGVVAGMTLGGRVPQRALGHGFALLVAAMGAYIVLESVALGGPAGI
jgi:uncharacterized protein